MKILQINATCDVGSTGRICVAISELLKQNNVENYIMYSKPSSDYEFGIKYTSDIYIKIQALKSRVFGNFGNNSLISTALLIYHINRIKPDIIHLHNIHGHNCNIKCLFKYLKKKRIKTIWTFHDCWAMTGYCTHFIVENCDKWKTQCYDCIQRKKYSFFIDRSKYLYNLKKDYCVLPNLTIVTPSIWMENVVKSSMYKYNRTKVIHNGIDLNIFKPTGSTIIRQKYKCEDCILILGVAYKWTNKKGLDVFIKLQEILPRSYRIIMVGTNDEIDKKLPDSIISIHRTNNQYELAEIYSGCDIFLNPTREENYPTVNMESIACGTPVITFNTGGCKEIVTENTGIVVEDGTVENIQKSIDTILANYEYYKQGCFMRRKDFDANQAYKEYIGLYEYEINH